MSTILRPMEQNIDELVIDTIHNGPPGMGNGGWTAGSLAARMATRPVEVTLRSPAPLGRPLDVRRTDAGLDLFDGETLVAEARPSTPGIEPPPPVDLEVARCASHRFAGRTDHPFPDCYVCGTDRPDDDGLAIFAGHVTGRDGTVAAPWIPTRASTGPKEVPEAQIWAALDCPTGWAHHRLGGVALLGRLAVEVHRPVLAGERHVVVAARGPVEGRKLHATAGIYDARGQLCAASQALWIEISPG